MTTEEKLLKTTRTLRELVQFIDKHMTTPHHTLLAVDSMIKITLMEVGWDERSDPSA